MKPKTLFSKLRELGLQLEDVHDPLVRVLSNPSKSVDASYKWYLVDIYRLSEIYRIVGDNPHFYKDGFSYANEWVSSIGKKEALVVALRWLGFPPRNEMLENGRYAELYQHGPGPQWDRFGVKLFGLIPSKDEIENIKKVCTLSSVCRSWLSRVCHENKDIGRLKLHSRKQGFLHKNRLSNDSGIYDQDNILISIGGSYAP